MESANTKHLTEFIEKTTWKSLPELVKKQIIKCSIDLFGAALAGTETKMAEIGRKVAVEYYPGSDASILLTDKKVNLIGATIANGMAINALDVDDGHSIVKGHPGAVVFPAVLAAAQKANTSLLAFYEALVVGYEIAIQMGVALQNHYDFYHSSGAWGASGAAAGVAKLLGLNSVQTLEALGIAEFNAPLTPVMRTVNIPSMNKDGIAWGGKAGMFATLLAKEGATGRPSLLEMPEYEQLNCTLGNKFEILNLYFKPYCCCRWAHPSINAALDLMHEYNISYQSIRKVNIFTFRAATYLFQKAPQNTEEAQYNVAYPVAAAFVEGEVGPRQVLDECLKNPDILNLMDKISLRVDERFEKEFPQQRLCKVEIELNSGKLLRSEIYQPFGEPSDEVTYEWIVAKFKSITSRVLSTCQAESLIQLLSNQQENVHIEQLFNVLNINNKSC